MDNWMRALGRRFEEAQNEPSDSPRLLLFDIDGTILDTRYKILQLLRDYDRIHGTRLFEFLTVEDIDTADLPGS